MKKGLHIQLIIVSALLFPYRSAAGTEYGVYPAQGFDANPALAKIHTDEHGQETSLPPENIRIEKKPGPEAGTIIITLKWEITAHSGNSIRSYRVYRKIKGRYLLVKETVENEYSEVLKTADEPAFYRIRSVSQQGLESRFSKTAWTGSTEKWASGLQTLVLMPASTVNADYNAGHGFIFSFVRRSFFINCDGLGIEAGYIFFPNCKDTIINAMFFPVTARFNYTVILGHGMEICPVLCAGCSYSCILYRREIIEQGDEHFRESNSFDPMAAGRIEFHLTLAQGTLLTAGVGYTALFDRDKTRGFVAASAGFLTRY